MVGLSRQRFMQLVKAGVFPAPLVDEATKRPYYTEELQATCLEVRRRNCGINGKVVMFYARRVPSPPTTTNTTKPKEKPALPDHCADILDGLRALGMVTATMALVSEAVKELFPGGIKNVDPGELIRQVFIHLRRKNAGENVGRKP